MKWISVSILTTTSAEDTISSLVLSKGITGVQIIDNIPPTDKEQKAMFNDVLPETAPDVSGDQGTSQVVFYLRIHDQDDTETQQPGGLLDDSYSIHDRIYSEDEIRSVLNELSNGIEELRRFSDIGPGSMELSVTSDSDWIDNWKQYYEPVRIGRTLIIPEWMDVPDEYENEVSQGRLNLIKLNPGTAFGTGSHETTKLALLGLEKYLKPADRLLDIGTGSGIIGLAALKLGAHDVVATEIDGGCVTSVEHNLKINGYGPSVFDLRIVNLLDPACTFREGPFRIITANILSPVIAALAAPGCADRFTVPGGIFITSGLAASREQEILEAFSLNPRWEVIDTLRMNDWISIIAMKTH